MHLRISPTGQIRCIYGEAISLQELGTVSIQRASHVDLAARCPGNVCCLCLIVNNQLLLVCPLIRPFRPSSGVAASVVS